MDDLVSVIVPAYNVEQYIERCLNSLCGQTYSNLEIIVVDDGSTDRTGDCCDAYAKKDERIQVIHQSNRGLSAARNTGIERAGGEYLCFVDSDDYVALNFVERLYGLAGEYQSDIAVCDFYELRDGTEAVPDKETQVKLLSRADAAEVLCDVCHAEIARMVVAWNKIYRRRLFKENRYPEGMIHEDEFLIHHLIGDADRIVYTQEQLYFYCIRSDSITAKKEHYDSRHLDVLNAFEDRTEYFREHFSQEQFRKMILAYCEMVTIQYRRASETGNRKIESPDGVISNVKTWFNKYMRSVLRRYGQDISLRKKIKYELFVCSKKMYFMYFWK